MSLRVVRGVMVSPAPSPRSVQQSRAAQRGMHDGAGDHGAGGHEHGRREGGRPPVARTSRPDDEQAAAHWARGEGGVLACAIRAAVARPASRGGGTERSQVGECRSQRVRGPGDPSASA